MWLSLPVSVAAAAPQVAVVVVDLEAREEGYALELEDLVLEDALPIDVERGETVQIVDPDGVRHPLDVSAGEAWVVSGPQGEAWMARIGEEVRTDVLVVRGDADAIRGLAEALHAEVRVDGDRVWLLGHDLLFHAPWAEARGLHRLDEVAFVPVGQEPPAVGEPPVARTIAVGAPRTAAAVAAPTPTITAVAAPTPTIAARVRVPAAAARAEETRPEPSIAAARILRAEAEAAGVSAPAPGEEEGVGYFTGIGVAVSSGIDRVLNDRSYTGMYACGDGTTLVLHSSGTFELPGGTGDWYVSAPGVVHLELVKNATLMRAAIELERRYCRAVW